MWWIMPGRVRASFFSIPLTEARLTPSLSASAEVVT
jgi:hypothetical protein